MKRYFGINNGTDRRIDSRIKFTYRKSSRIRIVCCTELKERENGIFFPSNFSWKRRSVVMEGVENKRERERERRHLNER